MTQPPPDPRWSTPPADATGSDWQQHPPQQAWPRPEAPWSASGAGQYPYAQGGSAPYQPPVARPSGIKVAAIFSLISAGLTILVMALLYSANRDDFEIYNQLCPSDRPGLAEACAQDSAAYTQFWFALISSAILVVFTIWGAVWALQGRSYLVLLIATIANVALRVASWFWATGAGGAGAGGVIGLLLSVFVIVTLVKPESKAWFAAQREARQAGRPA